MLRKCASLKSLGHQVISGLFCAKCTTCWPVPLPASSTSPDLPARKLLKHRPDRRVVAVECRRIETPVRLDRPAVPAEFGDLLRHIPLPSRFSPSGGGLQKSARRMPQLRQIRLFRTASRHD